jgi:hypothetical protein
MSIGSAFQPVGKTVTVTAGTAALSALIRWADLAITQPPQSMRVCNNGTVDVWAWFSNAPQTAAFPAAGTTTAGTPAYGVRLKPGVIEIFTFNAVNVNPNNEQPQDPGFYINTISTGAGNPVDVSFGEGL